MSGAKNRPASPLPLSLGVVREEASKMYVLIQAADRSYPARTDGPQAREDAAYLVHAGNAYERLVEQLKIAAKGAREEFHHSQTALWLDEAESHEKLLRDLGEAE